MGKLKKFHERRGNGPGKSRLVPLLIHNQGKTEYCLSVIIVPGLCASSLAEQTCCHFEKWIEENCGTSNTSMTIWIYHHGVELNTKKFWDYFCSAGGELINQILELYQSDLQVTSLMWVCHTTLTSLAVGRYGPSFDRTSSRSLYFKESPHRSA